MSLLSSWCKGEGVDPRHAVVVSDVPEDTEVGEIESTLENIKVLGRVRVRGRMSDPQTQKLGVLCECREVVRTEALPCEVRPPDGSSPWALSGPDVVFETKGTNPTTPKRSPHSSRCESPSPEAPRSITMDM